MKVETTIRRKIPENDRLASLLRSKEGRRLVILSGKAIREQFFLGKEYGAVSLIDGVTLLATQVEYDVVLWFDRTGVPNILTEAMVEIFELGLGGTNLPDDMEGWEETDQLQSESTQNQNRQGQTFLSVEDSSMARIHSSLMQIKNVCDSGKTVLAIFSEPERLWEPGQNDLVSQMSLLREMVQLSTHCGQNLRLLLTIIPGRKAEFLRVLDHCDTTDLIRQEVELGPPSQRELEQYLSHYLTANRIVGDTYKVATEWRSSRKYLYNLVEALKELDLTTDDVDLEHVLQDGTPREILADVQADIDKLVGLQDVKDELKKILKTIRQQAKNQGQRKSQSGISTHMVFLGNPGTGKTEMARLVGRYLAASGIRSSGEVVEISRSDIASEYNRGQCIEKMNAAIQRAMGGVLFVDEAYQMASNEWMREALETLMKSMEDHRDSLTVILAGYASQMQELWRVNPGFRSRIPRDREFLFPDYPVGELLEIFDRQIAVTVSAPLSPEAKKKVIRYVKAEVARRRLGNARGIRELVNSILRQRAITGKEDSEVVSPPDIPDPPRFDKTRVEELLTSFHDYFIGLDGIKNYLDEAADVAQKYEQDGGYDDLTKRLHCKFLGPPGTGKTEVGRRVAQILNAMGLISDDKCLEVNPMSDLLSDLSGGFAQRVNEKFEEARGGVLLIDEAYQLASTHQGRLVVDQIVQRLTASDFADTVVILAGYADRMDDLMACNQGLRMRFTNEVNFSLDEEDLVNIFYKHIDDEYDCPRDDAVFSNILTQAIRQLRYSPDFAHARSIINYANSVQNQCRRKGLKTITIEHLMEDAGKKKDLDELIAELDNRFVGLKGVKDDIREYARNIEVARLIGDPVPMPPRALFLGEAGTGKSSFAREYARLLRQIGCTSSDRFVEIPAVHLKGTHVGVAQDNVVKAFRDARGGMLFIDEIYSLGTDIHSDQYASDIVDALVGQTELPQNERTAIVLAGYKNETLRWLRSNPGLDRRFPYRVHFNRYETLDCINIFLRSFLAVNGHQNLTGLADIRVPITLKYEIEKIRNHRDFANAATIMELVSFVKTSMYARIHKQYFANDNFKTNDHTGLGVEDIVEGVAKWRQRFELDHSL